MTHRQFAASIVGQVANVTDHQTPGSFSPAIESESWTRLRVYNGLFKMDLETHSNVLRSSSLPGWPVNMSQKVDSDFGVFCVGVTFEFRKFLLNLLVDLGREVNLDHFIWYCLL